MVFREFVGSVTDPVKFDATIHTSTTDISSAANLSFDFSRHKEDGHIFFSSTTTKFSITRKDEASSWNMSLCSSCPDRSPILAYKDQWWRRNFEITMDGRRYVMTPVGATRADYIVQRVEREMEVVGRKVHGEVVGELKMTSRRGWKYDVRFDEDAGEQLPIFCFWLVTLMNRRRAICEVIGSSARGMQRPLARKLVRILVPRRREKAVVKEGDVTAVNSC